MRPLVQRLETSLAVVRSLPPAERAEALIRARRQAHTVSLLGKALALRAKHRASCKELCTLGRICRQSGFDNSMRQVATLAREHRSLAALAGLEAELLVEELRAGK